MTQKDEDARMLLVPLSGFVATSSLLVYNNRPTAATSPVLYYTEMSECQANICVQRPSRH